MRNVKKIFTLIGAYLGFLIGSGTATGQEMMQYFSPHGYNMFFMALVLVVMLVITNYGCAYAGRHGKFEKGTDAMEFYCGKTIGKIFSVYIVAFCYMSFIVMIAGGAATLQQQYGFPLAAGVGIITLFVVLSVIFGLKNLINIIGRITPILVIFILIISVIIICANYQHIPDNIAAIDAGTLEVTKIDNNWFLSIISNAGVCIIWLVSFNTTLGQKTEKKLLNISSVCSSIIFAFIGLLIGFSILSKIDIVHNIQIPNLYIMQDFWPPIAYIFAVLIFVAIYTSAAPLLWSSVSGLEKEKSAKFTALTVVLGAIGAGIAILVPFNDLLHYIYKINGYVGFVIFIIIVARLTMIKIQTKKGMIDDR